jgi:cob(I)alamin adenosyltransferase
MKVAAGRITWPTSVASKACSARALARRAKRQVVKQRTRIFIHLNAR